MEQQGVISLGEAFVDFISIDRTNTKNKLPEPDMIWTQVFYYWMLLNIIVDFFMEIKW